MQEATYSPSKTKGTESLLPTGIAMRQEINTGGRRVGAAFM